MPVVFQYPPSYRACAWITRSPASASAARPGTMTASDAPHPIMRSATASRFSSSGWPKSTVNACTSKPCSVSQCVTVQLSSPPGNRPAERADVLIRKFAPVQCLLRTLSGSVGLTDRVFRSFSICVRSPYHLVHGYTRTASPLSETLR